MSETVGTRLRPGKKKKEKKKDCGLEKFTKLVIVVVANQSTDSVVPCHHTTHFSRT